ncbi:MAG: BatD family protein [Pseudomonadota bacterium]
MKASRFGKPFGYLLTTVWLLFSPLAVAKLSATLDRYTIAMGDTVRLTLASDDKRDPGNADLSELEKRFEILQRSSSVRTEIVNGQRSQSKELTLELTPRAQGSFVVPPFVVDGIRSEALSVTVGPKPRGQAPDQLVVFEAELDQASLYVQGQLILTLRIQQSVNLDSPSITDLTIENAYVETLGQNSFQRTIDGQPWLVRELRYAIFPESSGELLIPEQTFSGRLASGRRTLFDSRPPGRLIRRQTEELRIPVRPRPASFPGTTWLPASRLSIEERWSAPLDSLRIGDSVTRTITLTGEGLQGAQLPPPGENLIDGLRSYPDQPSINNVSGERGITGIRTDNVALVAVRDGVFEIPAVEIPWWDTKTNTLKVATLPARQLLVAPANPAGQANGLSLSDGEQALSGDEQRPQGVAEGLRSNALWPIVAAFCAIGWLGTSALWWIRSRTSGRKLPQENLPVLDARSVFDACRRNDPGAALSSLRRYLRASGFRGTLEDWAGDAIGPELSQEIGLLESRCFSGTAPDQEGWNGSPLATALKKAGLGKTTKTGGDTAQALPPLYLSRSN